MTPETRLAAIGTYSSTSADGVYTVAVDSETGSIELLDSAVAGPDPTFVAPHPNGEYLYAAVREEGEGVIKVFGVNRDTGVLREVNAAQSGAFSPCHCSVDSTGRFLFVAHYFGGAISMLPIDDDGTIESPTTVVNHRGSSVHDERQNSPHPHSITPGPDDQFVYVADLGTDQIITYRIDRDQRTLERCAETNVEPGSGPRHIAFGPNGDQLYVINELDSTVTRFDRRSDGSLVAQVTVSTLPNEFYGQNKSAEIAVHPSGRYVFASNRGQDAIVTFAIDDGRLERVDVSSSGGEWPWHFAVDPNGDFLFAANRYSDDVTGFRIDGETGSLVPTGEHVSIPEPVCFQWL
ncbi:lactonase family protein [Haloterrigena sp. SYSU A121-1]|uniref:Lactonase family protein n=1 Tax=Haloterrigena gelatinilytica TaxID=2741724 RepID=A0A8J8KJU1_9EURY|nr:lactonase family protein [Haloterrigena gelatinilytica]NUB93779.1 lactonase family protein [Haloterrigena gelatinilytica]